MGLDALEAFKAAAAVVGLQTAPTSPADGADIALVVPGTTALPVSVQAAAIASADRVRELNGETPADVYLVLVADQISSALRTVLNDAGIGWLDRRGHLRLVRAGIHVDTDIPVQPRTANATGAEREPIKGRSGLAAASALLLHPEDPPGVSDIARIASLNPSSITRAMARLAEANLADRRARGRYRPLVPELFWALADAWPREHSTIHWSTPPDRESRLGLWDRDLTEPGWAAGGVMGAVAWGAPIAATGDFPIKLYAPSAQLLRQAKVLHEQGAGDEALLSVDPIGFVTHQRYHPGKTAWPIAHPLFCALDLTASSRDREALDQWTPPEEFTRVW